MSRRCACASGVNPTLDIEGVLLTMNDERTNLGQQVGRDVREFFKERSIDRDPAQRRACGSAEPRFAVTDDPSRAARSLFFIRQAEKRFESKPLQLP